MKKCNCKDGLSIPQELEARKIKNFLIGEKSTINDEEIKTRMNVVRNKYFERIQRNIKSGLLINFSVWDVLRNEDIVLYSAFKRLKNSYYMLNKYFNMQQ